MKKVILISMLSLLALSLNAQDLTQNYRKLILNSPDGVSLFQSNSTNGVWGSGMITADRWSIFEDATSTKEWFTILPGGNVGIGTTNPVDKFQVDGGSISIGSNGGSVMPNLSRESAEGGLLISRVNASDGSLNKNLMIIKGGGNVGIGTTTPTEKLEVYGDGASIKLNASNSSSLYSLKFTSNYSYSNKFTIQSGDAVIMQEKSIADVGGTGNTNSKLFLSNYYGIGFSSASNPANNSDVDLYITGHGNSVTMGNIGIGTTTPDSKLSVNGNIHTKEVKVDLIGWSDFVFKDDYELPTLKEVEQHIKDNGHLQDIPSAEEVAENGILLGEMDSKLLQKIEELTLYTIEQQKEIETLETQVSEMEVLKKENEILKSLLERVKILEEKLKS